MILRLQRVNEEEAGDDGASDDQLNHENTVDLPHEVPSDGLIGETFQSQVSGGLGIILARSGWSCWGWSSEGRGSGGRVSRVGGRGRQDLGLQVSVSHLTLIPGLL